MSKSKKNSARRAETTGQVLAVIELGTTSIRMAIAQLNSKGRLEILETLQQAVSLGRDAFTTNEISPETTEECVKVLKSFSQVLTEYQVSSSEQVMAVATSAVRESLNREAFLDRIYIGTGIRVQVIDEAEVNRFTYLAIAPALKKHRKLSKSSVLVIEVGGGSTEVLTIRRGTVGNTQAYRMGSLRLRKMLEEYSQTESGLMEILHNQVDRTVSQIVASLSDQDNVQMVALGGDARLALSQLVPEQHTERVVYMKVKQVRELADSIMTMSVDDVVRHYHIPYPDAETLGPALLVYAKLAQRLKCKELSVGMATLRDGLLQELTTHGSWTADFKKQALSSAEELAVRYGVDQAHARRASNLAAQMFKTLKKDHKLDPRYELILQIASTLHEVGCFVSNRSHHKHSMYLILNSDVFGIGSKDLLLTSLVARYHRRALPKTVHPYYDQLDTDSRIIVAKLAAILRVADALSRRDQTYQNTNMQVDTRQDGKLLIGLEKPDLTVERHALREKGDMFKLVYGREIELHSMGGDSQHGKA